MLGVVVPCFNEEGVVEELIKEFEKCRQALAFDVIFIDDGSIDGTGGKIKGLARTCSWIKIVMHEKNQGLAQSLKDGFSFALKEGYDVIGQMDSDLTHPPALLQGLMDEMKDADLVIASRYIPGGGMKDVPSWRVAVSRVGNKMFRLFLRITTLDATSGYRVGRREVYERLVLKSDSFGIQLEATVKAERLGFRVKEFPFVLESRRKGSSKFRARYLLGYIPLAIRLMVKR